MTPLFKKYERVQRSHEGLSGKGNRSRRWLFKAAFEDLQIRENVRFLDEIWLTVNEGFIQRIIDPPIVAGFKRDLFPYGFARLIDVLQQTNRLVRAESRLARHNIGLQAGLLLVDTVFNKRPFMTMDDEFWIGQLHQMAGFDNRLQVAVEQLGLKGIVRIGLVAQATDVVRDMVRATEQGDNLVQGMDAQAVKRAVLRQAGLDRKSVV